MISLIHPSRGRPEKSRDTITKWINLSNSKDIEVIISLDIDDSIKYKYEITGFAALESPRGIFSMAGINRSAVDAINEGAKVSTGNILIVVSDDTDCYPGWDAGILQDCAGKNDFIIKTQDGIQKWIITMPIMDRAYYNRFGYIYHPDYLHMFCDTELTCVADLTGRKIVSNLMFKHNHYSVTKERQDEVSKRADKTWDQGEKLFLERYKRNFDLKEVKGKIQDNGMINWLLRKHALKSV